MADFVLVHGAWHGAWCWRRVLPLLWRHGHRAFALDLTGLGARRHLFRPDIGLSEHVQDVVELLDSEELRGAVLVGHSYAGLVVTGAADQRPDRVGALVYVDAVVPRPGEAWSTTHAAATQAERRALIAATGALAPPDPKVFGLSGDDHAWVARRQTPQPGGCYDAALHFDADRWQRQVRHFVDCTEPALPTVDVSRRRVREESGWHVHTLATGHDPMITAPNDLAKLLHGMASPGQAAQ
ncbi:alpha/beta fold hydrolase [Ideonella sp.]|uniref:alpha/beta fold hydrolase n=1 Tax=Ideonella sp. TaxID=1929293 RepID=UPI0035B10C05